MASKNLNLSHYISRYIRKKTFIYLKMIIFVALVVGGTYITASAQVIKLHLASWNVPADPTTKVLETIAADLKTATGGRVTSEISFQALGKPGDYYDALAGGLCDIAYIGLPYTPGRFPLSEGLMLPIAYPNNIIRVKTAYAMWKKGFFDKQFANIKVFAIANTVDFLFMWRKTPVTTLTGFKGKKVSAPGGIQTEMVGATGATPVNMPVTEIYSALETGVIDGACQGWPFIPVFKAQEVVKYATEPSRSAFPCIIAINKASYNKLPKEAKAVIDNNSEKYSLMQAEGFQKFNDLGRKMFLDAGGKIDTLSAADTAELDRLYKPIFSKWATAAKAKGLPADRFLDELYVVLVGLDVKEPFAR